MECKFIIGDYVKTTYLYKNKWNDHFEGTVIDVYCLHVEVKGCVGVIRYFHEDELELVYRKESIKSCCKFKIGNKVIAKNCDFNDVIYTGIVNNIEWNECFKYWKISVWTIYGVRYFNQNDLELDIDCDKNLKDPSYMSDEMKFLKTGNYRNCNQISSLLEEIKTLKQDLKCKWKYNNSIKEECRIQNSCYRKTINSLENKVKKLNIKINNILYYLMLLTVLLTITWMKILGVI